MSKLKIGFSAIILLVACITVKSQIPAYLKDYRTAYEKSPREANRQWFKDARFGMFIHYGLYSQLGKGEWVQLRDTIPLDKYIKLKDSFSPSGFDAKSIVKLAKKAGMKYITITSKHHEGFCLFKTKETELLTQYPSVAGIWFDPVMGFYANPDVFPMAETYALIRKLSPHALISFKQGANGDEDFMAPKRGGNAKVGNQYPVAVKAYKLNQSKPKEVCNTMQPHLPGIDGGSTWGYNKSIDGHHLKVADVKKLLDDAKSNGYNLLLNVGPLPDGSIHPEDIETLSNLKNNPLEINNLASLPEHKQKVDELMTLLNEWHTLTNDTATMQPKTILPLEYDY